MPEVVLGGCTATPFGAYLKALGVFRLVAEQSDPNARAHWDGDTPVLSSTLDNQALLDFFLTSYRPTPILAPWNRGSGFYKKDRKIGIDAIAQSADPRFAEYRCAIESLRSLDAVLQGDADKLEKNAEEQRRLAILVACRNRLPDRAVEWIDAAVGIAADGDRSFAPVLGTGGNEGRLDYTNNFMERLANLLLAPDPIVPVRSLLSNSLFNSQTEGMQSAAAGQYDPGRAGGSNQGQGISSESPTNPWDLILTLEGAVAWASGLYRRQGVSYRSFLCSPFTVRSVRVGYASASGGDEARAEVWTPLWPRPAAYPEVKALLREGRSSVNGRPAETGLQFAEAVCSLGVDRGIDRFVRYNLLKRRGDSYVALPVGIFPVSHRQNSDRIRELSSVLDAIDQKPLPSACEDLRRSVDKAIYEALLRDRQQDLRAVVAALGRLLRRMVTVADLALPRPALPASDWLSACGSLDSAETRLAAAIASIYDAGLTSRENHLTGAFRDHLQAASKAFSWFGRDLCQRMIASLDRRLKLASGANLSANPGSAAFPLSPGDIALFIEQSVDDQLIEDLLFGFTCLRWTAPVPLSSPNAQGLPLYSLLKCLFLPYGVPGPDGETVSIKADPRVLALLQAGDIARAAEIAVARLRVAGLRPLEVQYLGGVHPDRLAAALLLPVRASAALDAAILHPEDQNAEV